MVLLARRFPADPPKSCFLKPTADDNEFLKIRRNDLNAYIERILILVSETRAKDSSIIEEFLGFNALRYAS